MSDQPPEPVVTTRKPLTAEDIAKINRAMEACEGDQKAAAEILGMDKTRLAQAVQRVPSLSARWKHSAGIAAGELVTQSDEVNRTTPKELALTSSERMAIELSVTEKKLNRSLVKLGFRQKEIEAISAVEEFAGNHFQQTLSIMHGGLLKSAMRLMLLAERIESTYLQDDHMEERDRKYWWDTYFKILEKLRDFNEQTNKAALTKALIEIKRKEAEGGGVKNTKPSFQPLSAVQVNVTGAKDVKVSHSPLDDSTDG
jgi:hypothetical protein